MGLGSDEITCRDNLLLTERPTGDLACVKETSAETLQWDVLTKRSFQVDVGEYYPDIEPFFVDYVIKGGVMNQRLGDDAMISIEFDIVAWKDGTVKFYSPLGLFLFDLNDTNREGYILLVDGEEYDYKKTIVDIDGLSVDEIILNFTESNFHVEFFYAYLI